MEERGQVLPLVLLAVALAAVLCVALGQLGARGAELSRAQAAADAVALAGAAGGRDDADSVASANGARIVTYDQAGADVSVVVELGGATARSRASTG